MSLSVLLKLSKMPNPNCPSVILIDQDLVTIGRCGDIKMDTSHRKEVSKIHTTIYRRSQRNLDLWIIEDNSSLNGTFVNGRKIHRTTLHNGDEIVFGGGSSFCLGDIVSSTELAECRYKFYQVPPLVKFCSRLNLNGSLIESNLLDMCTICLCPAIGAESLPCGHKFCLSCIHSWTRECAREMRPSVCPLCRTPFAASELTPEENSVSNGILRVYSVEPMLRDLGVRSCKQVKAAQVMKPWNDPKRAAFWNMFEHVKKDPFRKAVFLHLTKATVVHAFRASREEVSAAAKNLGGKGEKEPALEFLQLLFEKIIYQKENKPSLIDFVC